MQNIYLGSNHFLNLILVMLLLAKQEWQNMFLLPITGSVFIFPLLDHDQSIVRRRDAPRYISWSFSSSEYININTDGSFMQNSGLAGFEGITRDDKGGG